VLRETTSRGLCGLVCPSRTVGCLFLRSPSRVPYRTELLPRAPKGRRTLGTECIHYKGGAHSSKTHLILIQACDPRPSRIGNLVSVHPRCGGTCRIGVLRARAGAHPPAPARNHTQGFAAARRCRRTWDGIALAQTQTRASCVRQHATLNTKTGRQRVTAAALLR
jgi:hypothetical protein